MERQRQRAKERERGRQRVKERHGETESEREIERERESRTESEREFKKNIALERFISIKNQHIHKNCKSRVHRNKYEDIKYVRYLCRRDLGCRLATILWLES